MSNAISALDDSTYDDGIARVRELGLHGMITLRGDMAGAKLKSAAKGATGVALPDQGRISLSQDKGIAWMSPDEALILCPYDSVADTIASLNKALSKAHALVANVSDARALFEVKGPNAREVMAKLAPVDLAPDAFTLGMFRRTRMAQVAAAFWMVDETSFRIVCFRSVAEYMFGILKMAAQPGSNVGYFR